MGTTMIPAGDYTVRRAMEGQDHGMTITGEGRKDVFKVEFTLVSLDHKATRDRQTIEISGREKVLPELILRGDSAMSSRLGKLAFLRV